MTPSNSGKLPLQPGQVYRRAGDGVQPVSDDVVESLNPKPISVSNLPESEKKKLREMGWKDGEPLPCDFAERLKAIRSRLAQPEDVRSSDLFKQNYVADLPPIKNLDDLDEKEKAEVSRLIGNYRKAINTGEDIDDLMGDYAAAKPVRQAAVQRPEPVAEQAAPEPATQPAQDVATNCPRCFWDQKEKWPEEEITLIDKQSFVRALAPGKRFRKTVVGMGGIIKLTFRTLTAVEKAAIQEQLDFMLRRGQILGDGGWMVQLMYYRMFLMLEAWSVGTQTVNYPDYKGWCERLKFDPTPPKTDDPKPVDPTAIPQIARAIELELDHEPFLILLQQEHRKFQLTYETMIARSTSTDFFDGIVP